MSLSRHVNPEDIIEQLEQTHVSEALGLSSYEDLGSTHLTPYSSRYASQVRIPKYKIPEDGTPADTVHAMLQDELDLDGRPGLNLATFVTTKMDDLGTSLLLENVAKNLADNDEYPAMINISERCVSIIAHLWAVQPGEKAIGSPTVGSSEAIHLGGLAMKRRWQERRRAEGKDTSRPNIIMGANAQVALEKFARYFEVEARILPVSKKSSYRLDPDLVRDNIDENTIGVFVILGSTYTGHYEPVEEISKVLDEFEEKTGVDIPIHVDAASGGFIAPFSHAGVGGPKWNFELPRVKSINASGHKYGLVYAGLGWIIWRDESFLPKHLIFELHYLGGTEQSYTLNFSRPGGHVVAQYYNLIHLGAKGYREIMENCLSNARVLSRAIEATGFYTCLSDIHRPAPAKSAAGTVTEKVKEAVTSAASSAVGGGGGAPHVGRDTSDNYMAGLPVVAFRFSDEFKKEYPLLKQETVSLMLRARQWIIPNYALPPVEDATEILRVVIRENMSFDLLDRLVSDIVEVTETLMGDDSIDLSVLQKQKRTRPDERKKPRALGQKRGAEKKKGVPTHVAEGKKRMADGIHRSVC
ncbi:glutamate decarboxylase [Coniochaeta ligniaria NRRL 30616]|uniref:Glutamate decarboxylase n=1 Tax=Coniochaeta ligniaria NRRL 30616 TaxID=1408157 RepID=A0A1J7JCP2_9PEZI|nr:glutamate decarboxylase [Coniochaeta ligniaria NRRL 30616]